jgi:hypothetical protein
MRHTYRVLVGKLEGNKLLARLRSSWQAKVKRILNTEGFIMWSEFF